MSIPIHTTLITVKRATAADAFDRAAPVEIANGIRAHIGSPGGTENVTAGSSSLVTAHLSCDPTDLAHGDVVVDESTGLTYEVTWVAQRRGFGLDHTSADLLLVTDRAAVS